MTENMVMIEKERVEFLLYALFGNMNEPFPTVSKRAYRDLCRTLHLNGKNGSKYSAQVDKIIEKRIIRLLDSGIATQTEYDRWHYETCIEMIDIYKAEDVAFTFGHAQKWINMALKYLFIHGSLDLSKVFAFLHVPIDSYIFTAVENQLHIDRPCAAWSKIDDYCVYLGYQYAIRDKLKNQAPPVDPLRWEFGSWLAEANKKMAESIVKPLKSC